MSFFKSIIRLFSRRGHKALGAEWFRCYTSCSYLSQEDREFLCRYDRESFQALIPDDVLVNYPWKLYLPGAVMIIRNHEQTGEWVYPPKHYPFNQITEA